MKKRKNSDEPMIAYKFRIYPTEEQKIFFSKTIGCVRLVYNLMLNDRIKAYEESKGNPRSKRYFLVRLLVVLGLYIILC